MPPPGPTPEQNLWIAGVLGIDPAALLGDPRPDPVAASFPASEQSRGPQLGLSPSGTRIGQATGLTPKFDTGACQLNVGPALAKDGPDKAGAQIMASVPQGPPVECQGVDGRKVSVTKDAQGRVQLTHPPAPIDEITFSGGGGKGAALPGAVWALAQSGVLAQAKEMHGASVGSMTAAMLAAGMTPQEFQDISDKTDFSAAVKGDDLVMVNSEAKGLEAVVRNAMKTTLNARIADFMTDAQTNGVLIDPQDQAVLTAMSEKFAGGKGPTFGDLRELAKIAPAIKEVVMTATMIGTKDNPPGGLSDGMETGVAVGMAAGPVAGVIAGLAKGMASKSRNQKPELVVFSASTEPDVEVALAVHASAALPPVFKPVEITLHDGTVGLFEDGGVLNNAPSSDTLGDRSVDPVPDKGKMTFIFEDDASAAVMKGGANLDHSRVNDFISGADNSAADYAKNKTLSEKPQDVMMVPLKFTRSDGKEEDRSGLFSGTMAFSMPPEVKLNLQKNTAAATSAYLDERAKPETLGFASDAQMLNCVPRADLKAMADSNYPGAKETLAFREGLDKTVAGLEKAVESGMAANDPRVQGLLKWVNDQAKGDQERLACIGRELNRSGKLDGLLAACKNRDGKASTGVAAIDAGLAVNEVVQVRAVAKTVLDQTLYPRLVKEGRDGKEGKLLTDMERLLRAARTRSDINAALMLGIDYFSSKFDALGLLGNGAFADALRASLQPLH